MHLWLFFADLLCFVCVRREALYGVARYVQIRLCRPPILVSFGIDVLISRRRKKLPTFAKEADLIKASPMMSRS